MAEVWDLKKTVMFCIPFALIVLAAVVVLLLRNTFRAPPHGSGRAPRHP